MSAGWAGFVPTKWSGPCGWLAALAALLCGCAGRDVPATVSSVDLARYAGTWHEVARIPNWFQRACVGPATAEYTPRPDGRIRVVNACLRKDGRVARVEGSARVVNGSGGAKLKVRFFGPFEGDYWILGLDQVDYRWAVVGHPSRKYLWFLSRSRHPSPGEFAKMEGIAKQAGYDFSKVVRTEGNSSR